jgi:hypothetical protein
MLFNPSALSCNIVLWFHQLDPIASLKDHAGFKQESFCLF